ncbi:glycosyltransferase [Microbacterium kunmingense]|uniref:glycosyltransferase n=1 Tax=Microbacterium kunmingense TaxID=2915939 RepID=UPI003D75E390
MMLLVGAVTPVRVAVLISATAEPAEGRVLVKVSDPVVLGTSNVSQTLLGDSDQARPWVAVLGAITRRKNVPIVADAVSRIPGEPQVGLVVAGKVDDEARESLEEALEAAHQRGVPTLMVDRHLTDGELDGLVYAADCVVVAHSNEGPSGLVGKAAAAGTPLALAGAESLRRDAETLRNLATWAPLNSEMLAEGIARALTFGRQKAGTGSTPDAFACALMPELLEQTPGSSVS